MQRFITIIDWYIIKKFLGTFVFMLGLFVIISVVFDVSEKLDDFINKKAPISAIIFDYYLNFIPILLNLFSPIFIFISVIFFTSKLASNSEIISILAAGVSFNRILRPYFITATLLAIFSYFLNSWIIPECDKKRVAFENQYVRDLHKENRYNIHRQIEPGVYLYFRDFSYQDSSGSNMTLEKFENGELRSKLFASHISWNKQKMTWRLNNYMIRYLKPDKDSIVLGQIMDTLINFNPADFFRRNDDVASFNMDELRAYIAIEQMRGSENVLIYITEYYRRFSAPFAAFVLTFIGMCVAARKARGGIGLHLGAGIMISFAYLFVLQFAVTFANSGVMPAYIGVWIPNVIFFGVGLLLFRYTPK